ncbi:nitrile hydratase subunit beta [Limibaculum sp. M0105]|uniref:Nitrile hydratase subunit beta n=1 Tax=Thermohalobaculum xanthum TaxID=2753746 RepID=A0A8J7M678_9RHOB|nr:SH3-like domain-containing protein [Thermohalobaculum xanthum]MBK0399089.1 nitrile hydratase subunit beta [Thermohalobaculum xanthum]
MTAPLPEVVPTGFPPPYPTAGGRFRPGQAVRVRHGMALGHLRTPFYLRGRVGRIERICGDFQNPEELAYNHRNGMALTLYRVRFTMAEIWGETAERPADTLDAEIFEHWLEPSDAA